MRITNVHETATIEVHGTTLGPRDFIDGERCEQLITMYPGVGSCIGCGVLEGDDDAKTLVELTKPGSPKATAPQEQKSKGKPGPKPQKPDPESASTSSS